MAQELDAHEHDSHGQTPAAWTAVTIVMIAFFVGTLGVVLGQYLMLWIGVGLVVLGGIVGNSAATGGMFSNGNAN